ncbi:MAG: ABC transporter substrate-binding protein [Candidatus Peribacteraceae bacterium]
MHSFSRPVFKAPRWERIVLLVCIVAFLISALILTQRFIAANTILRPAPGGTYIEGSVGEIQQLIPWFTVTNDVNRDIVSLVFSGLLKYNPETQKIEEDLATLEVSPDNRIYTLTLKEGIAWHDSTPEDPHYLTPEDVLFTFQTIQDPQFPNTLLRQNFLGIDIEQINERTVRFRLEEPYSFFTSNLTLGILPKRSFEGIPVAKIDQALDFGFHPIGTGPYAFRSLIQTELSTEITLERLDQSTDTPYNLSRVIFRVFPDYSTLLSDIRNLNGVRLVPRNDDGKPIIPRMFQTVDYTLPQYVALFFNLDRPILQDQKLRLGLQLGTNKQALVEGIGESLIVDTPLMEIDLADWRYQFDPNAARGAFFESNWHLPEKVRLQRLLEIREANTVGSLSIDPIVLLDTGAVLTITGSMLQVASGATVNGLPVVQHPTATGAWIVNLPTHGGTGSLLLGLNMIQLQNPNGSILDSAYVWRTNKPALYRKAAEEQQLVDLFIQSRDAVDSENKLTVEDLYIENGMLRRRLSTDPQDIRVNNNGEKLSLVLLTSDAPSQYRHIAEVIRDQWAQLGVHVGIEVPATREDFEKKLLAREYDILLFGQSLLDNLDSYPYWHSSGVQKLTGERNDLRLDAYNLSQYSSLKADTLLEVIRQTSDEEERDTALNELRDIIRQDVPAVFLYAPQYTFAYTRNLQGVVIGNLSLHSDRFLTLRNWFLKQERVFKPGKSWFSFIPWLFRGS